MAVTGIDRRVFLSAAAGALALPALSLADGQKSSAMPDLGFSLYGMKTLPLDVALKTCAEIGYSHVEFALNTGYPTEPATFSPESRRVAAAQLKELRLGLPCLMLNISLTAEPAAHAQSLELISAAGRMSHELMPEQPPILETVMGGSPARWEEQKSGMADRLHDWADAASKADVVIAIKAHVSGAVNSPERLLWLLDQVKSPAIKVTYDYSHFEVQGIGLEESMSLLLPHTRFIHVKDSSGSVGKFQFLLPGEGRTDYRRYFSLLRQHNYSGPVCVEVSSQISSKPGYDPIAAARKSFETLSTASNTLCN